MEKSTENESSQGKLKFIEMEGKTPEEAIEKALAMLRVSRDEVRIKILAEEEKGLFGMDGARPAKIRATVIKKSQKQI